MKISILLQNAKIQKLLELRQTFSKLNQPNYLNEYIKKDHNISLLKPAAVLVPISVDDAGRTYLTFTRRSQHMKNFRGECCFIGGNWDETDKSYVETALREAKEEVGLDQNRLEIIAEFKPFFTSFKAIINPIIALFDDKNFEPKLNKEEVDLFFKVPTSHFLTKKHHHFVDYKYKNDLFYMHYFNRVHMGENLVIPGVTAVLSSVICTVIDSKTPDYEIDPLFKVNCDNINNYIDYFNLVIGKRVVRDMAQNQYQQSDWKIINKEF